MIVPYIPLKGKTDGEVFGGLVSNVIEYCNWPDAFPAKPGVSFKIFHDGGNLYIQYTVDEPVVAAVTVDDDGPVWRDSCVEFFVSLDGCGYYNFEMNCIGALLIGYRDDKISEHAGADVLAMVKRCTSFPREAFAEVRSHGVWTGRLTIPVKALFRHDLGSWAGLNVTANFYKCGDDLSIPHFLSWRPIDFPKPNFHLPEFFGPLVFEISVNDN